MSHKKKIFVIMLASITIFLMSALSAVAHQPRDLSQLTGLIEIEEPEVSKAYYGELTGKPQVFKIVSDKSFDLYVNILSPAIDVSDKDFSFEITKAAVDAKYLPSDETVDLITKKDGTKFIWTKFYEEFASDNYFKGPEYSKNVSAGIYYIKVYSPDDRGKYTLATGKLEHFTLKEILNTFVVLQNIKTSFWGKNAIDAYLNLMGAFLAISAVVLAGFIYLVLRTIKKLRNARPRITYRNNRRSKLKP